MLSRRFADEDGALFFFDKANPQKGVQFTRPSNLFVKRHLYSSERKDGSKDASLESEFRDLEGLTDQIIRKIIEAARRGQLPALSSEERRTWDLFFYYQLKRSPEAIEALLGDFDFDSAVREKFELYEKYFGRPISQKMRDDVQSPAALKRLRQSVIVQVMRYQSPRVLKALGEKGLGIVIIKKARKSFVLGSHAMVKLTPPEKTPLSDPRIEWWLPIASDVTVSIMASPPPEKLVDSPDDRHIRSLNKLVFKQSRIIAGRSRALIASLAGCD